MHISELLTSHCISIMMILITDEAMKIILSDSKIFRLGLIQGLTEGALQTFVFLWSPFLIQLSLLSRQQATQVDVNRIGLDRDGVPFLGSSLVPLCSSEPWVG